MNDHPENPRLPVVRMRLLDSICDQFERAWRSGERPRIADFLVKVSGDDRQELARQLIDVDIEQRMAAGLSPSLDDYRAEFPELAEWLERRWLLATEPLQGDAATSVTVSWNADAPMDPAKVRYGSTTSYGTEATGTVSTALPGDLGYVH